MHLLEGTTLPWCNLFKHDLTKNQRTDKEIRDKRMTAEMEKEVIENLSPGFANFYIKLRELDYISTPVYNAFKSLILDLLSIHGG